MQEEYNNIPERYNSNPPDAFERIFQGPLRWVNLVIIAINILVYIVMEFAGSTEDVNFMLKWGAAYTPAILNGEWYRLITSMFLHFGFAHLFNNMLILLFMGDMLEEKIGKIRYFIIYMVGGILGNLLSLAVELHTGHLAVSAGASGAVFAVIGGVFILFLKERKNVRNAAASRMLFVVVLTIYYGFQSTGIDNAAHIGGVLSGVILTLILYSSRGRKSAGHHKQF